MRNGPKCTLQNGLWEIFLQDKYVTVKFNNPELSFMTLISLISNMKKKASEMNTYNINPLIDASDIR